MELSTVHTSIRFVDALTKVLPTEAPDEMTVGLSGLQGERIGFQVAWLPPTESQCGAREEVSVDVRVKDGSSAAIFQVEVVPVQVPCLPSNSAEAYMTTEPTVLPDVMKPLETSEMDDGWVCANAINRHIGWNSVWIDVLLPATRVDVRVSVNGEVVREESLDVRTVPVDIPRHKTVVTHWFHVDCLATYYGHDVWSEENWETIENQLKSAAEMGVNSVLAPVWTPPTDTRVGSYRRVTQLVDITREGDTYRFDWSRLDRWIELTKRLGFTNIELPHLFTQWGARFCPQFIVNDGVDREAFGWDVRASDPSYLEFLTQFIPALRKYLDQHFDTDHVWFHISDEPHAEHLDDYQQARDQVAELLTDANVIDALSDPEFLSVVDIPVVATDAVNDYRAAGVEPSWVYHCVSQNEAVANRFIAQHGTRHRQMGVQLYKNNVEGFLHWALNFYNEQLSVAPVDPFADTAAGGGFISGDPFIVYPGPNRESWPSIRHRMVGAGFQDLAVCQYAESLLGREQVLSIIDPEGQLDYDAGWVDASEVLRRRRALDDAIEAGLRQQ